MTHARSNRDMIVFLIVWIFGTIVVVAEAFRHAVIGGTTSALVLPIHNLIAGNGYAVWWGTIPETHNPPGTGLLAYLVYLVVDDVELSTSMVSAVAYVLMLPVVFFCARRRFGSFAAGLGTLSVAFVPKILEQSFRSHTEASYTLFLVLAFFLVIDWLEKGRLRIRAYAALGFFLAFATLIRPEVFYVAIAVFVVGWGLAAARTYRAGSLWTSAREMVEPVTVIAVFLLVLAPYSYFLYKNLGYWTFTGKGDDSIVDWLSRWFGYRIPAGEDLSGISGLFRFMFVHNADVFYVQLAKNYWDAFTLMLATLTPALRLLVAGGVALAFLSWRGFLPTPGSGWRFFATFGSLVLFCVPLLLITVIVVSPRNYIPYVTLIAMVIGWGTALLFDRICMVLGRDLNRAPVYLLALFILLTDNFGPYFDIATKPHMHHGLRAAGIWFEENEPDISPSDVMVIGSLATITYHLYHSRPPRQPFPKDGLPYPKRANSRWSVEELAHKMKELNTPYLVLAANQIKERSPLYRVWLDSRPLLDYGVRTLHAASDGSFKILELVHDE